MLPHHKILDIGCGSLRGGRFIIKYLNSECYYGLEKEAKLVAAAIEHTVPDDELDLDDFILIQNGEFDLAGCPNFDFMLAHSVFNHCNQETIHQCFRKVLPYLKYTGNFFATYIPSANNKIHMGGKHKWRTNEFGNCTYPFSFYQEIAKEYNLKVEDIGTGWETRDILKTMRFWTA